MTLIDDSYGTEGSNAAESSHANADSADGVGVTARAQAQQVAGTTMDEAAQVAQTAKEQALAVTADVRDQTRQLAEEARGQLMEQAGSQRDRAVESLRSVGSELSDMVEKAETSGLGVQLAREGGELTHKVADFLESRDPGQLLEEVRGFARRRPAAFLIGAAVAGVVVGRAVRGAQSAHSSDESGSAPTALSVGAGSADYTPYNALDIAPVPAMAETDSWGPDAPGYPAESGDMLRDGGIR